MSFRHCVQHAHLQVQGVVDAPTSELQSVQLVADVIGHIPIARHLVRSSISGERKDSDVEGGVVNQL